MKRYNSLKESHFSAVTEIDTDISTDQEILRISISSELSAINLYKQLANKAQDPKIREILLDIAKEEQVHVGEFQALLNKIDNYEVSAHIEGKWEVEEDD